MELKYLIISMENYCVFTMDTDVVNANNTALSNFNSFVRPVSRLNFKEYDSINARTFFKDKIYKIEASAKKLTEMNPDDISESWKTQRELIWLRQEGHAYLGMHHEIAISLTKTFHWDQFPTEALEEIKNCDPTTNSYTRLIEEYSRALDKPINHVYKELKLKLEGEQVVKFRISALTQKWKSLINKITTREELEFIKEGMITEFWVNHRL